MEFVGDFFPLRFFGRCCAGLGRPGRHQTLADVLRTLTTPIRSPSRHLLGHMGWGGAACQTNQTFNQTSGGSLVFCSRLPHFSNVPFHFPFRGEKASAPRGWFGVLSTPAARPSKKRVAAPCSYLGPAGGATALPTGSATRFITYSRRVRVEGVVRVGGGGGGRPLQPQAPAPNHPPLYLSIANGVRCLQSTIYEQASVPAAQMHAAPYSFAGIDACSSAWQPTYH